MSPTDARLLSPGEFSDMIELVSPKDESEVD